MVQRGLRGLLKERYRLTSWIEKPAYARGVLRADRLRLPDFLGLGGPQSGSDWLYLCLDAHPDTRMPRHKELHYWDRGFHRPLRTYSRQLAHAGARVTGDITPSYCALGADRIRFVRRIRPEMRMIYVLRDPVDRDWSAVRRHLARREGLVLADVADADLVTFVGAMEPKATSQHAANLRRWRATFPDDQILVLFYDDLASRPVWFLEQVFAFLRLSLDIDWAGIPTGDRANPNPERTMPEPVRALLRDRYRTDMAELREEFPAETARW